MKTPATGFNHSAGNWYRLLHWTAQREDARQRVREIIFLEENVVFLALEFCMLQKPQIQKTKIILLLNSSYAGLKF